MSNLARQVQANTAATRDAPGPEQQVREAIKRRLPTIKALLPDVLDERKLAALVLTEVYKTPKLAACSEETLIGCVLRAAALGLQFGQDLGQAYLIPRGRDCTLQLGYRGVIALAQRSGAIKSLTTRSVYTGDTFAYGYGLDEHLDHTPTLAEDRTAGDLTHAYAVVRYTNGGTDFEVLDRAQIETRRKRGGDGPAWRTDYAKMAEKSAILAMRARLPLTTDVATALAQDGAAITVSTRGPAHLEANHTAIEAAADPETGEVTRDDPGRPFGDDDPADPT